MRNPLPFIAFSFALAAIATGAAAETVEIYSAADWDNFANRVNAGETSLGAVLKNDIALSQSSPRVGTSESSAYGGVFDGKGHTLVLDWTFTDTQYAAPFAIIDVCSIHDLHVAGSITSNAKFSGGLVGWARVWNGGSSARVRIERCRVSAEIVCTISGDSSSGGFIGLMRDSHNCRVEIRDCLFDGSLLGPTANCCGGFVGWKPSSSYLYVYNSLFAPAEITVSNEGCGTFTRSNGTMYDIDDNSAIFYTRTMGSSPRGRDASGMTAEELAAALGSNWTVAGGMAMLAKFATPATPPEAASAGAFSYQGVLRDAQGHVLLEKRHKVAFKIYDQATGGSPHWGRSADVLLDDDGLFSVEISDVAGKEIDGVTGTGLARVLAANSGTTLYVGLTVDGSSEIAPRQKLLASPYAMFAADASAASGEMAVADRLSAGTMRVSGAMKAKGVTVAGNATAGSVAALGTISAAGTVPVRGIITWSGVATSIPEGWAICDGKNGTPDLRDRFIVGAGSSAYNVGDTGGEAKHRLSSTEMPRHGHSYSYRAYDLALSWKNQSNFYAVDKGDNWQSASTDSAGGDVEHENRPPYYALCYIMRVR